MVPWNAAIVVARASEILTRRQSYKIDVVINESFEFEYSFSVGREFSKLFRLESLTHLRLNHDDRGFTEET